MSEQTYTMLHVPVGSGRGSRIAHIEVDDTETMTIRIGEYLIDITISTGQQHEPDQLSVTLQEHVQNSWHSRLESVGNITAKFSPDYGQP
jgi:hypothetical protein